MANNLIAQVASEFLSGKSDECADIITFAEAPWGLNLKLLPAQRFMLRAFYGLPLGRMEKSIPVYDIINEKLLYTFTEFEFLKYLHSEGRCNTAETEGKLFSELLLSIGRRGTKSTCSAIVADYELYKLIKKGDPAAYYGFPPTTKFHIINVATTDEQATAVFDMIKSFASQCMYLRDRILHPTMAYFDVATDADYKLYTKKPQASIEVIAGSCSASSVRGKNGIVVIMDEFAHFIDNGGRYSGAEVYKALVPSTAAFKGDGKVICMSSPYAKYGAFWDRYQQSFEEQDNTLMFRMYSAMVNYPNITPDYLKMHRRRNRAAFNSEYGGEFSDSVMAWIDDEGEFRKCISNRTPKTRGTPDVEYYMSVDLGFKKDGSSIAIVHKENNKIVLDYADVWYSGSSDVWEVQNSLYADCSKYAKEELIKMTDIVNEIAELHRWFPIKKGIFDQMNGYALAERLHEKGWKQFEMQTFTDVTNSEIYNLVKRLYAEQLLDLYDHPVLIPEMLTLEAANKAKGKIDVRSPDRVGAHDDIFDAFSRAVWLCSTTCRERPVHAIAGSGGLLMGRNPNGTSNKQDTFAGYHLKKMMKHGANGKFCTGRSAGFNKS